MKKIIIFAIVLCTLIFSLPVSLQAMSAQNIKSDTAFTSTTVTYENIMVGGFICSTAASISLSPGGRFYVTVTGISGDYQIQATNPGRVTIYGYDDSRNIIEIMYVTITQ